MTARTGYAVAEFSDPEAERARLARQAEVVAELEERLLADAGLPDAGHALDVGCGPGFVAKRLMRTRPGLDVTGIDLELPSLRTAREVVRAVRGDATRLPFPDGRFDFVYARAVLRHLAHPERALAEMVRVASAGAPVAAVDVDDGTLVLDPAPSGFDAVVRARHASIARRGANPFVGRALRRLAVEAGLEDVHVEPMPISSDAVGAGAFAAIILRPFAETIEPELLSPDAVRDALDALDRWATGPASFGMITAFVARGRSPGSARR